MELDAIILTLQEKIGTKLLQRILENNFDSSIFLTQRLVINIKGDRLRSRFHVSICELNKEPITMHISASQLALYHI